MARLVGKQRAAPLPGMSPKSNSPIGGSLPSADKSNPNSPSVSSSWSTLEKSPTPAVGRAGRAGFVRASAGASGFSNPAALAHGTAFGRGHSAQTVIQQNYQPFLDKSYFVSKGNHSDNSNMLNSMASAETTTSRMTSISQDGIKIENFIYLDIEIVLHNGKDETSISQKTLGFDIKQNVRNVMTDICSYVEIDNIKPLYLLCKNTGEKLEEGTLLSNKIESEFLFELHVIKDDHIDESDSASLESKYFVSRLNPTTIYLSLILFNTSRQVLTLPNGMLPCIEITSDQTITEEFGTEHKEFIWAVTRSLDWENSAMEAINQGADEDSTFTEKALKSHILNIDTIINGAMQNKIQSQSMKSLKFKRAFYDASLQYLREFKLNKLGFLYHQPVSVSSLNNTYLITAVQFCNFQLDNDMMIRNRLKWRNARNLQPNFFKITDDPIWALYLQYYQRSKSTLAPGVYVGLFKLRNTVDSLDVLCLKHDPNLIPLTRLKTSAPTPYDSPFIARAAQQHSETGSKNSTQSEKKSSIMLNEAEIAYLKYLAESEKKKDVKKPDDLVITKELEALGQSLKSTIKALGQATGVTEIDLKHYSDLNPIYFRKDCLVLLFTIAEDLQAAAAQDRKPRESSSGFFSILGLGKSKDKPKTKEENSSFFQYLPMALFEVLHQSNLNSAQHATYRKALEPLLLDQLRFDVMDEKTAKSTAQSKCTTLQQVLGELNEKKKLWNSTQSWALRTIQHNRNSILKIEPSKK